MLESQIIVKQEWCEFFHNTGPSILLFFLDFLDSCTFQYPHGGQGGGTPPSLLQPSHPLRLFIGPALNSMLCLLLRCGPSDVPVLPRAMCQIQEGAWTVYKEGELSHLQFRPDGAALPSPVKKVGACGATFCMFLFTFFGGPF